MARISASSEHVRTGTAAGLARVVARPGYLQKVAAEPLVRRLVPFLIIAFLGAAWAGTIMQLNNSRAKMIGSAMVELDMIATLATIDFPIELARNKPSGAEVSRQLKAAFPPHGLDGNRQAVVTDQTGRIVGSTYHGVTGQSLDAVLGTNSPLLIMADSAGVLRITLPKSTDALATVRNLPNGLGQIAVYQPMRDVLESWRSRAISKGLLAIASTIVICALGLAFFQQSARAVEADVVCGQVRARIDQVLSSGRSGLWDWDIARGRIFWSDSMYALLGRQPENDTLSFADVASWLHPADANPFDTAADILISDHRREIDTEFRLQHADGRWIWIRARGSLNGDAQAPHLVGIAVDVTQEKAEAEVRATADMRLRDAVETISEAFALFDARDNLVLANSKFQHLLSLPAELMRPGTPNSVIVQASSAKQVDFEETISDCEVTGSRSYEMRMTDGRWFQVNERATKDGGHVSVSTDITEHKNYEQSLATSNEALEKSVVELEASQYALRQQAMQLEELAESHLEKKAEAESANRAKAQFLANMSHELRTPLNHIIGFAEMMESGVYGELGHERYVEYTKDIGNSGRYLLDVISDILDMSSLEAGRVKLERKHVALADELRDGLAKHQTIAEQRGISIEIDTAGPLHVVGDRKALRQMMDSLLGNAVKFTPDNGHAGVRARRVGDNIQLFFEDNGSGISPDTLARMGRPFEQNGSVIDNGYKGSGLGFSIAKSLAELHGGSVRVRSRIGVGTIVMVTLPVHGASTLIPRAAGPT
jgi:two-component system, cell cycle sensor histidine kinase PleC